MTDLGRPAKYPYVTMDVGDWFSIAPGDKQPRLASVVMYSGKIGREYSRKFNCYQDDDGVINVSRVS